MTELYKDDLISIQTAQQAAANGHLEVKLDNVISLADTTDDQAKRLFLGASQVAVALFELVGAHGTNIMLTESQDDLTAQIVARQENDGLNFMWQPNQGNPEELQSIAKSIKDKVDVLVWKQNNPNAKTTSSTSAQPTELKEEKNESGEIKTNYLLKSIKRSP